MISLDQMQCSNENRRHDAAFSADYRQKLHLTWLKIHDSFITYINQQRSVDAHRLRCHQVMASWMNALATDDHQIPCVLNQILIKKHLFSAIDITYVLLLYQRTSRDVHRSKTTINHQASDVFGMPAGIAMGHMLNTMKCFVIYFLNSEQHYACLLGYYFQASNIFSPSFLQAKTSRCPMPTRVQWMDLLAIVLKANDGPISCRYGQWYSINGRLVYKPVLLKHQHVPHTMPLLSWLWPNHAAWFCFFSVSADAWQITWHLQQMRHLAIIKDPSALFYHARAAKHLIQIQRYQVQRSRSYLWWFNTATHRDFDRWQAQLSIWEDLSHHELNQQIELCQQSLKNKENFPLKSCDEALRWIIQIKSSQHDLPVLGLLDGLIKELDDTLCAMVSLEDHTSDQHIHVYRFVRSAAQFGIDLRHTSSHIRGYQYCDDEGHLDAKIKSKDFGVVDSVQSCQDRHVVATYPRRPNIQDAGSNSCHISNGSAYGWLQIMIDDIVCKDQRWLVWYGYALRSIWLSKIYSLPWHDTTATLLEVSHVPMSYRCRYRLQWLVEGLLTGSLQIPDVYQNHDSIGYALHFFGNNYEILSSLSDGSIIHRQPLIHIGALSGVWYKMLRILFENVNSCTLQNRRSWQMLFVLQDDMASYDACLQALRYHPARKFQYRILTHLQGDYVDVKIKKKGISTLLGLTLESVVDLIRDGLSESIVAYLDEVERHLLSILERHVSVKYNDLFIRLKYLCAHASQLAGTVMSQVFTCLGGQTQQLVSPKLSPIMLILLEHQGLPKDYDSWFANRLHAWLASQYSSCSSLEVVKRLYHAQPLSSSHLQHVKRWLTDSIIQPLSEYDRALLIDIRSRHRVSPSGVLPKNMHLRHG